MSVVFFFPQSSDDPMYRISSLEGQLRQCQNKLTESLRKFETELVKQHLSSREALETMQKEHESEMCQAREKNELLERKIADMNKVDQTIVVTGSSPTNRSPSGPPSLQPKSPTRRKKRLKKGASLTPNCSKSELVSVPPNPKTASSDTDILTSFKDRPKSSSYGDLTTLTKEKHSSDSKLSNTPQLSPANARKDDEKRTTRRENGDKLTITALVAESMSNPGSISAIRKELKSDSFTPKIKRKFANRSSGTPSALPSMSPSNGVENAGKEGKSPLNSRKDMFDRIKETSSNNDKN